MARLTNLKPRVATLNPSRAGIQSAAAATRMNRGNTTERGYGWKWQKARSGFLAKHPLCRACEKEERTTAATVVDHIIPHKGDENLFWSRSNWQPMCKPCHDAKTAREDGGFGNTRGGA